MATGDETFLTFYDANVVFCPVRRLCGLTLYFRTLFVVFWPSRHSVLRPRLSDTIGKGSVIYKLTGIQHQSIKNWNETMGNAVACALQYNNQLHGAPLFALRPSWYSRAHATRRHYLKKMVMVQWFECNHIYEELKWNDRKCYGIYIARQQDQIKSRKYNGRCTELLLKDVICKLWR